LEQDLPNVNSIDFILNQCTYFGLSFARVGVDFTGRIADIFIKTIKLKIQSSILMITKKFKKNIENSTLIQTLQKCSIKNELIINSVR
jgi:hypothetical protein